MDATFAKDSGVTTDDGTSLVAGIVAGLAAYLLGFGIPFFTIGGGRIASNSHTFLKDTSWPRARAVAGGVPRVLWNLKDGSHNPALLSVSNASAPANVAIS